MSTARVSRSKTAGPYPSNRDPLPEPTFLQIHGPGNATMRMVELPQGPVRVGRGAQCEVRLGGSALAEVQCLIRRRGNTWHVQPVGPAGLIWVDDQPVDHQRPLRLGVPFRVGEDWLTLRPADSAVNDWGSFDEPIIVEPQVLADDEPAPFEPREVVSREPLSDPANPEPVKSTPSSTTDDREEKLRRWQTRLEQRERFLKDRQDEKRWEARWKSAGESIRARSASPTPAASVARSAPPPATPSRPTPRRSETPIVARIVEPRPSEPLRRVAEPTRVEPPRVPVRPVTVIPEPVRKTIETPRVRIVNQPFRGVVSTSPTPSPKHFPVPVPVPLSRSIATPTPVDWSNTRDIPAPVASPSPTPIVKVAVGPVREIEAPPFPSRPVEEIPTSIEVLQRPDPIIVAETIVDPIEEVDPVPVEDVPPTDELTTEDKPSTMAQVVEAVSPTSLLIESSSWLSERSSTPELTSWDDVGPSARVAAPLIPSPSSTTAWPEPDHRLAQPDPVLSKTAWPSAKAIFAAQGNRPHRPVESARPSRRRSAELAPTDLFAPAQWILPLWIGWLPILLFTLAFGSAGLALSYEWTIEANQANLAFKLALRPEGSPGSSIDLAVIPKGGWWLSNATHLSAWALAIERLDSGQDLNEEVRSFVDASRNASQLSARSRFLVEAGDSSNQPTPKVEPSDVGRTRDVITLAGTGRRLRLAGKLDSSLRAYRAAMELAARAGRENLDPPDFDENPQVRRYALPRESLLRLVALDMVAAGVWTSAQWNEALPPTATASLVVARILGDSQKQGEADRLAELAIRQAETNPPPGYDPAEHRAAGAEALAYRGRWTDSAEQYRLAIDQVNDDATRRMWWLNLAEIVQRVGDDAGRARAIEAAKSPDSVDEITKRALKYQQALSGIVSSNPRR